MHDYIADDYDLKVIALVSCPTCGAQIGQMCTDPEGDEGPCMTRYELYARTIDWFNGEDTNESWTFFGV